MPTTPRTVLSIEDTSSFRHLIRMALELEGFKVIEASDGRSGLAKARSSTPDLILLDLKMADMDGLSVCREIMLDSRLRRIPVVMLSISGDPEEVKACLEAGAQQYLVKPFRPQTLVDLVHQTIDNAIASGDQAAKPQ